MGENEGLRGQEGGPKGWLVRERASSQELERPVRSEDHRERQAKEGG